MSQVFDITEEELPIFQAEAEEHLQVLEEGLVRLEREKENAELVQAIFRAAHTLKGSAGMIGHKRMVDLTHAMETILDGVRKNNLVVNAEIIDTCLQSLDFLQSLCLEVVYPDHEQVDVSEIVMQLSQLAQARENNGTPLRPNLQVTKKAETPPEALAANQPSGIAPVLIHARISPDSIASAARAFQIIMALQDLGEITSMEPSLEVIESASPVPEFKAWLVTKKPLEEIKKPLTLIAEIDQLSIGKEIIQAETKIENPDDQAGIKKTPLGEILVRQKVITQEQLQTALQKLNQGGPAMTLGQILVGLKYINQEVLDEVIAEQKQPKPAPAVISPPNDDRSLSRNIDKTVRTSVERLDNLMNLIGELITDRNRLYQLRKELEVQHKGQNDVENLSSTITHVGRITDMLQAEVMSIRMLPVSNVFNKMPRLVRDLSRNAGKQVDLVIRGENTELDRSVIEVISDPLIHLIRNAVDHGIENPKDRIAAGKPERGVVLLTARHEQGRIIITVEDNGKGIDGALVKRKAVEKGRLTKAEADAMTNEEAIDLIFVSGLSTATRISDVSGRGVGMDIVRSNIERLNGNVLVESWPGRGSQFSLVLPLTLAIVPTLLVEVSKIPFAIPLVTVSETLRIKETDIQTINTRPVILLRDTVLPVNRLSDIFELRNPSNGNHDDRYAHVVVVKSGKSQMGLMVDRLIGEQEVVVKSLSTMIGEVLGISSAAILGNGQVALIIDVQSLLKLVASKNGANFQPETSK